MQIPVALFGTALILGAGALAVSDYSTYPPEAAPAVRLSSFYLGDDNATVGAVRLHLDKIGYSGAARVFNPALGRDPANSTRWVDAGESFAATGDREKAEYAYRQAEAVAPNDPVTLLAIGYYYLGEKQPQRAAAYFSHLLSVTGRTEESITVQNVFAYLEQMHIRDLNLLDAAIPDARNATLYLRYLMAKTDPAAVRRTWRWMHEKHFDDDAVTAEYAQYLFRKKEYAAAGEDWQSHAASRRDGYPDKTAVYNGGFEYKASGSPFDWEFGALSGITAELDPAVHHDGSYSMRVDFTRNDNLEFYGLRERAFVTPGRYRLDAWMRTAAITSAEGMRMRVKSYLNNIQLGESDGMTGTHDWTPVSLAFDVSAGTNLIEVELARDRAIRIDNQLTGKVWLDSVTLTRLH